MFFFSRGVTENKTEDLIKEEEIDTREIDDDGYINLIKHVKNKDMNKIKILLDHGSRIFLANNKGETAVSVAVKNGSLDIIKLFYEKGKLNLTNPQTYNVVNTAISNNQIEIVDFFVKNGINVNFKSQGGQYFILIAAMTKRNEIFKYLIENGADVNVKTIHPNHKWWPHESPLEIAVKSENSELIEYIMVKCEFYNSWPFTKHEYDKKIFENEPYKKYYFKNLK